MTRYFFHLHEAGQLLADDEGAMLPDIDAVRERAIAEARSIMCAGLTEGRLCLSCNIEVLDDAGRLAVNMPFRDAVELVDA